VNSQSKPLIAHLSDQVDGGAAIAANRMAFGLAQMGELTQRWFCAYHSVRPSGVETVVLEHSAKAPWFERLIKNIHRPLARKIRQRRHERLLALEIAQRSPRLLHLHNLHASGLNHESLMALPPDLTLAWTLHDCFPVLPHAYEWVSEQGHREVIGEDPKGAALGRTARARFFASRPGTVLVAPSRWIAGIASAALGSAVRVEVIPHGIPCTEPITQAEARSHLGLPVDRMLLGVAAVRFDRRKGGDRLFAMLRQPGIPPCEVVAWGDDAEWVWPSGITWHRFGLVAEVQRLAQLYSACDLFICPSRIDNLPNTVLESMACGTPVIGSQVGGIPELVRPGQTGWLFDGSRAESGAQALRDAFAQKPVWGDYRQRCRALVMNEFSLEACARKHIAVYHELL